MLSCRGQRLRGSGLLAPGGVLELLHQTKRTPPPTPLVSTVQGYMRKRSHTHEGAHARTHTLCAGTEPRESFLTPTHDEGGGEGKGL